MQSLHFFLLSVIFLSQALLISPQHPPSPLPLNLPTPPSQSPPLLPLQSPSNPPSQSPKPPSQSHSLPPSQSPSKPPSQSPSKAPSQSPSKAPSQSPSNSPLPSHSNSPSLSPSPSPSSSPSPYVACKSTPYPKLCRTILSAFKSSPSDPYRYGKFTIKQCLKQTNRLSKAIAGYSRRVSKSPNSTTVEEIAAISDCGELSELSTNYLETVQIELKSAEIMTSALVERVNSLLSGVVTNQQTCLDGLIEAKSAFAAAIGSPIGNLTRLYSVSLGLVTHALNRNLKRFKAEKKNGTNPTYREPLETLIKGLRKTCDNKKDCRITNRKLGELGETSGGSILINRAVIVGPYDTDNFTTITDAIAAAPNNTRAQDGYFVIYARKGIYEEYIFVPLNKKDIMLIGDGINKTIITGNHNVIDGWTTYNSSSFAVVGERFMAVDVTFRNTAGPEKHQAVAMRSNSEGSSFYRCSFEGYQDTLYVHSMRQFYRDCDIYGTVDFIFGNAAAVFQNCNIYVRKPMAKQKNAITAHGRTDLNQNTGISIINCKIQAAPDLAADPKSAMTFLGRPWKIYSRTVYMQSYISDVIQPVGWLEWNGTLGLDTIYYGEYSNYGPGASTNKRVQWLGYNKLNLEQAVNFTVYNFTMGDTWIPQTDIPFFGGLIKKE